MKPTNTTLPIGDFDSITQKLQSAVRALAFATQNPDLVHAEIDSALYLIDSAAKQINQFVNWSQK